MGVYVGKKSARRSKSSSARRRTRSRRGGDDYDVESGHGAVDATRSMEEGRSPSPPMMYINRPKINKPSPVYAPNADEKVGGRRRKSRRNRKSRKRYKSRRNRK